MKNAFCALLLSVFAVPAFAADHYTCTSKGGYSVDQTVFTSMDFYVDGSQVTGSMATDFGVVPYNKTSDVSASLTSVNGVPHITVGVDYGHDYQHLDFDLVDGQSSGAVDLFIDCVGEFNYDQPVECHKLAN